MDITINLKNGFRRYLKKYETMVPDVSYIEPTYFSGMNSIEVFKVLFEPPVKLIFYWGEDDYQGSLFVVYQMDNVFFYIESRFGSCGGCDAFEACISIIECNNEIESTFNEGQVCTDLNVIEFGKYSHPELISSWNAFKTKKNNENFI